MEGECIIAYVSFRLDICTILDICVIPSIQVIDGNKGLINGWSCMATIAVQKQQSRTLNKVFIEIITMPT